MAVPVPGRQADAWRSLGKVRNGERNRPWSAGAEAGALATGLAQGTWMLRQLASMVPDLKATTQPGSWRREDAQLLLAEAFVTAHSKPTPKPAGQHAADAVAAGLALVELLDNPQALTSAVRCSPQGSFSLLVAMALWAELFIDPGELNSDGLVVAPRHPAQAN